MQKIGGVVVPATAWIVGAFGQDERARSTDAVPGRRDGVGDGPVIRRELCSPAPHLFDQGAGCLAGCVLGPGLMCHGYGRTRPWNVRPRKADLEGDHVDAGLLLEFLGHRQQVAHDAGLCRAPMIGAFQHRGLQQQAPRLLPAFKCVLHQPRRLLGPFVAVDVWIGTVAHKRTGVIGHPLRGVGMQVERGDDGNVRPDHAAQRLE